MVLNSLWPTSSSISKHRVGLWNEYLRTDWKLNREAICYRRIVTDSCTKSATSAWPGILLVCLKICDMAPMWLSMSVGLKTRSIEFKNNLRITRFIT